ncbi:hypothetical protein FYK55_11555 [Roseiconus nitratireducens]|uniref:Uncharacterized protein n=1 Tax=Roseiconus nitratireducens TaxID=2605748 RepID=A0A5M6DBV5_9BACT|nr:hypothetical protein [Roseiconus nitratireducens]KAA5543802.1 hypothetical protein FYK55_11555 [Roseiconus nitratireducens]
MNGLFASTTDRPRRTMWRLWVDGCGGFLLVTRQRVSVGGMRPDSDAAVQVRSDWRRHEGELIRQGSDYFWVPATDSPADVASSLERRLLRTGEHLPITGVTKLSLEQPSPLSGSAVLSLAPPHRFSGHVDRVLLVDQTVLIGRASNNHIRLSGRDSAAVLLFRDGRWHAKHRQSQSSPMSRGANVWSEFVELVPGQRVSVDELDMTLEQV